MRQLKWARLTASVLAGGSMLLVVSGCGGSGGKFKDQPRPPIPTQLTGVITDSGVTVSPDTVPLPPKPGQQQSAKELDTPILLIVSNQTQQSHTITLTGKDPQGKPIEARTPPINPLDTAQIQQSLPPGTYQVRAGTEKAVEPGQEIRAATLTVRPNHNTSSDQVQLP